MLVQKEIKRITIRPNGTEKQIRPVGWQPGADTIAYYPFKGDVENKVNTSQNATIILGNISQYYATLTATSTNQNARITCPLIETLSSSSAFTCSVWTKRFQYNGNSRLYNDSSKFLLAIERYYSTSNMCLDWSQDERNNVYTAQMELNTWLNIIVTYDGTSNVTYLYKNGVKYTYPHKPNPNNTSTDIILGGGPESPNGYFADLIVEKSQRTDQEVSDYYDLTKGNYGF